MAFMLDFLDFDFNFRFFYYENAWNFRFFWGDIYWIFTNRDIFKLFSYIVTIEISDIKRVLSSLIDDANQNSFLCLKEFQVLNKRSVVM